MKVSKSGIRQGSTFLTCTVFNIFNSKWNEERNSLLLDMAHFPKYAYNTHKISQNLGRLRNAKAWDQKYPEDGEGVTPWNTG